MADWIKNNGFSFVIAVAGIVATYSINTALYGYRLSTIEARQDRQEGTIEAIQNSNTNTQVSLAKIQTDIEYIKIQLSKITP